MVACTPQLTSALSLCPVTISGYLLANEIIPQTLHGELVHSGDTPHDKAQQLVNAMTTCTKANASNFNTFIDVLKVQGGWTKGIVNVLNSTYQSKKGSENHGRCITLS